MALDVLQPALARVAKRSLLVDGDVPLKVLCRRTALIEVLQEPPALADAMVRRLSRGGLTIIPPAPPASDCDSVCGADLLGRCASSMLGQLSGCRCRFMNMWVSHFSVTPCFFNHGTCVAHENSSSDNMSLMDMRVFFPAPRAYSTPRNFLISANERSFLAFAQAGGHFRPAG